MTLNIIDKAYAKKINRLKKRSAKYKQRSKYLVNVVMYQKAEIVKMTTTSEEIVQNFEETQKKLIASNIENKSTTTQNKYEFIFFSLIILWMCIFVSLIRMVHSSKGLSDEAAEVIYGSMILTSIAVLSVYCVIEKLFN
jgi:magnesium-transporting ATPase (P-type)